MTDRELLEKAAKAAGNGLKWADPDGCVKGGMVLGLTGCYNNCEIKGQECNCDIFAYWNPLADDGDALRLAVKLKLDVQTNEASASVQTWQSDIGETKEVVEYFDPPQDPYAATRRAIVRAAAEIGKEMP